MIFARRRRHQQRVRRHVHHRQRWAPPAKTAPLGVGVAATPAILEPFNGTVLDTTTWTVTPGGLDVTVSGGAAHFPDSTGTFTEMISRPFVLAGRSVTIEWELPRTGAYVQYEVASSLGAIAVVVQAGSGAGSYRLDPAASSTSVPVWTAADWRWIRLDSDPDSPADLTLRRSADARTWTIVTTGTIADPAELDAAFVYFYTDE